MEHQLLSSKIYADSFDEINCLYNDLWQENTTLLINTTQAGENDADILDIAEGLGREVVYVATDSRLRHHKEILKRADRLLIFRPAYAKDEDDKRDYADLVIDGIENIFETTGHDTFIIDSVTRIAALSFGRNASPAYVMKRLAALQMRRGISLIVISRDATKAVTRSLSNLVEDSINLPSAAPDASKASPVTVESASEIANNEEFALIESKSIGRVDATPVRDTGNQTPKCRIKSLSRRERRLLRRQAQSGKS